MITISATKLRNNLFGYLEKVKSGFTTGHFLMIEKKNNFYTKK